MSSQPIRGPIVLRDDKGLEIQRVEVAGADGPVSRALLVHPGAVVVLPRDDSGRLLLIQNRRWTLGATLWELCAGTLDPGEDPAACAARELREETGYAAAQLTSLGGFYAAPGYATEYLHAYLAEDLTEVGQDLDASEEITASWVSEARCREMVREGTLQDAKSLALLCRYFLAR